MLNHVLRDEWGFDGFVLSDSVWGIKVTEASVCNGLDMEMPITHYYGENLLKAVKDGKVSETVIHQSALRILRTLLAHQDEIDRNRGEIDYRNHQKLALQCAREGITLLRNKDQILPLDCKNGRKKIVVLGYLADCENIGDRGSSQVCTVYCHCDPGADTVWCRRRNRILCRGKPDTLQTAGKGCRCCSDRGRK